MSAQNSAAGDVDFIALARFNFLTFVVLMFPVLHGNKLLIIEDYFHVIDVTLNQMKDGKLRRVIFNLPPGSMKSTLVSVMWSAWRLGVDPTHRMICVSYGDDLAHDLSTKTRKLMTSALYGKMFPGTILDKKAEDYLITTKGGARYATSVGSDVTGFRADSEYMDDPLQPDDATSEPRKLKLRTWVEESLMPRLIDQGQGEVALVMHRVANNDLTSTLSQKGWTVVSLPLVCETPETFTLNGQVVYNRNVGDVLMPNRLSKAALDQLKAETPPHVWASQYQQRPILGGSGMLSLDRLRYYDKPPVFERLIHSWDIGATLHGNATVCTTWGLCKEPELGDVVYLRDVIRLKLELPDVRAAIKAQDELESPSAIIIDHRGVGLNILQDLRRQKWFHVMGDFEDNKSTETKIERFGRSQMVLYDGCAVIPHKAKFLDKLLQDLAAFPSLTEFDLIDSITQLLAHLPPVIMHARINLRPQP